MEEREETLLELRRFFRSRRTASRSSSVPPKFPANLLVPPPPIYVLCWVPGDVQVRW